MREYSSAVLLIVTVIIVDLVSVTSAATHATNISSSSVGKSNADLTWIVPSDLSQASYYVLYVLDEGLNVVLNETIDDVNSATYSLTQLTFSTYYNVTIYTHDATDDAIGSDTILFVTDYDPLNFRALCAIGVVGALILILIVVKLAGKICNPDKGADKWKQEILETKQKEREDRKRKMQAKGGSRADLDDEGLA
ncbi:uncharacterized protein LOC121427617 [Lytechinus variegatus]|uniref:uncharacterized protein LOC121427617 n=1 Tax=Lytechinus variegatus TaxID=7654 RepID=UPI001BB26143|nr:uncharacterized protein LOC121427617 [Lytechinus variegatus]